MSNLVALECDHCGNDTFYVYESPDGEQQIECEMCRTVMPSRDDD